MAAHVDPVDHIDEMLELHKQIHERALTLQPLPRSVTMLANIISSEMSSIREVTSIVEQDPVLVGRLLRVANSPWSSPADPIGTADAAVMRLGTAMVLSLSIGFVVKEHFSRAMPYYSLDADQLWRHSFMCSVAAELVREHASVDVPPEVSTAALLHDVGKVVLHEFLDERRGGILTTFQAHGADLIDAEAEALDVHHAEIGAVVCEAWDLPESIRHAVRHHHRPNEWDSPLGHAVFLADQLSHRIEAEQHPEPELAETADLVASMETLGVDPAMFPALVMETITRYQDRATLHEKI